MRFKVPSRPQYDPHEGTEDGSFHVHTCALAMSLAHHRRYISSNAPRHLAHPRYYPLSYVCCQGQVRPSDRLSRGRAAEFGKALDRVTPAPSHGQCSGYGMFSYTFTRPLTRLILRFRTRCSPSSVRRPLHSSRLCGDARFLSLRHSRDAPCPG